MPATVENRTNTGVRRPASENGSARVSIGQRLVVLEVPVRPVAAGVHHPLGNPLVIEMEDLLPEMEILQHTRPALAEPADVFWSSETTMPCWVVSRGPPSAATW